VLNVPWAISEALDNFKRKAFCIRTPDYAVEPITPACGKIDAQNADGVAVVHADICGIVHIAVKTK